MVYESQYTIEVITDSVVEVVILHQLVKVEVSLMFVQTPSDKSHESCGDHLCLADSVPYRFSEIQVCFSDSYHFLGASLTLLHYREINLITY